MATVASSGPSMGIRGDWRERLTAIVDMMRELSLKSDPQEMVQAYGARMRQLRQIDRTLSLSRRGLESPWYRITRFSEWQESINPWKQPHRLPMFDTGLLGELIYADEPRIINDLQVADDDPAAPYLAGQRSLVAIPQYDRGTSLNMIIATRTEPNAMVYEELPELVWVSNLFGRATQNLVLADQLKSAYEAVDRELKVIAEIQRSLLPSELPRIPGLQLAAHYRTARRAGGDYYDFFPLPENRWGILIADVSGHGTPAAVMMAITHSIAHGYPGPPTPAAMMLEFLNRRLSQHYTGGMDAFVTAFYGIYDPATHKLSYASAGHNPPLLKHCEARGFELLDAASRLPLGIWEEEKYVESEITLKSMDRLVLYTDGITEAENPASEMFGLERLQGSLGMCRLAPDDIIAGVLSAVDDFCQGEPVRDDQTMIVMSVQ